MVCPDFHPGVFSRRRWGGEEVEEDDTTERQTGECIKEFLGSHGGRVLSDTSDGGRSYLLD